MKLYTIYDNAAKAFAEPFSLRSDNEARRVFLNETKNPKSNLGQFPEDFALYSCGEFDNQTGEFITPDYPVKVCTALEIMATDKKSSNQLDFVKEVNHE